MKKKFNITIVILFGIILIGKVSNWFLNFSEETNQILSAVMFILIGIAYIVDGFVSDRKQSLTKTKKQLRQAPTMYYLFSVLYRMYALFVSCVEYFLPKPPPKLSPKPQLVA